MQHRIVLAAALLAAAALAAPATDLAGFNYDPKADARAIVSAGDARFTVLTPYVIRMEYSAQQTFEDRATLMAVNRKLPVPQFTHAIANGVLTITTAQVVLTYTVGQPFSAGTLSVASGPGRSDGFAPAWRHGAVDSGNLLGTIKSLDQLCSISLNCTLNAGQRVHEEGLHCGWGVVSRLGWATVDDSKNYILSAAKGGWFSNALRAAADEDRYFFGHGTNFRQALTDYVALAGVAPMTDRALLGSWFTRWFDYANEDIVALLDKFEAAKLPLDVLVLDMNWHKKNGWTGWSWDTQLYPYPKDTVDFVHSRGLKLAANLHDAMGVGAWEDLYKQMADAVGWDAASNNTIYFQPLNSTYMHAVEDVLLQATGIDFYWIDWQQGGQFGGTDGGQMNPTFITDHVRGTDHMRRGENKRGEILARWGGMGSHRYPVGFSGDISEVTWKCFAYQPYFSTTAANVAYGSISHDLLGPANDHELHVRWLQFGAYSGVMRIHDRGMSSGMCALLPGGCDVVDEWLVPYKYFAAIRAAMQQRVALLPYIYAATFNAYKTGVAMMHPMYYDFPTEAGAYVMTDNGERAQYMFGDDFFVAPVVTQADPATGLVTQQVWVPPGKWYDAVYDAVVAGPATVTRQYTLDDIPMFYRAGAVVPRIPESWRQGIAAQQFQAVTYSFYPGLEIAGGSVGTLYEDDGNTNDYLKGGNAQSEVMFNRTSGTEYQIVGGAMRFGAAGGFAGALKQRSVVLVLVGMMPPVAGAASVTVDGQPVPYSRFGGANSWTYDATAAETTIDIGSRPTAAGFDVKVALVQGGGAGPANLKLFSTRMAEAKRLLDTTQQTPYSQRYGPGMVKQAASRAGALTYLAGQADAAAFAAALSGYKPLVQAALTELQTPSVAPPPLPPLNSMVQLWRHYRRDMLLCGTDSCRATNGDYETMWVEGFQPLVTDADAVPLHDLYNANTQDNWATNSSSEQGYSAAVFLNGLVLSAPRAGKTRPLQVWVGTTGDHMTTASAEGLAWAKAHGYTLLHAAVGHLLIAAPAPSSSSSSGLGAALKRQIAVDVAGNLQTDDVNQRLANALVQSIVF
jgi:alpha-glucosidase